MKTRLAEGSIVWKADHLGQEGRQSHPPGWLLRYRPSLEDCGRDEWYSTEAGALAALAALGGRAVSPAQVDLTPEDWDGCARSLAWVESALLVCPNCGEPVKAGGSGDRFGDPCSEPCREAIRLHDEGQREYEDEKTIRYLAYEAERNERAALAGQARRRGSFRGTPAQ